MLLVLSLDYWPASRMNVVLSDSDGSDELIHVAGLWSMVFEDIGVRSDMAWKEPLSWGLLLLGPLTGFGTPGVTTVAIEIQIRKEEPGIGYIVRF